MLKARISPKEVRKTIEDVFLYTGVRFFYVRDNKMWKLNQIENGRTVRSLLGWSHKQTIAYLEGFKDACLDK